ncbi:hypothetical protein ACFYPT_38600 [Streptomyces sp. NPDC005529]|uniref:hypothetical protein n=1 Tax=unclassified Streptomyces TaxID=2593676 RepID=UPI0033AA7C67
MSSFGAGICRGVMAVDQFTQVANSLFRDPRLSFRAKGVFGYISTHRTGWVVTVAALVALGPDGRDAVRAGLKELESHGYLMRDRVRRPNGTLGPITYSITDRPAIHDLPLAESQPPPHELGTDEVTRFSGAGIRRGVMAADQYTQVANGFFRDPRLSFKAKGLFGHISTHRDGWRLTLAHLERHGREGLDAVTTGLQELQEHGFLVRDRARNTHGTLAHAVYCITDLPAVQNPCSQPESGYPRLAEPRLADPGTKNTIFKKTNKQNTNSLRPCRHDEPAARPAPPPATDEMHPGIRLLLEIGASRPDFLLTGKPLTDQGRVATLMLEAGWSCEQLRHVITDRPLPQPVRTSVGAIISARLRAAQAYPPPSSTAAHDYAPAGPPPGGVTTDARATEAAARTVTEALTYRALTECAGCGVPTTAPGQELCPACLGWPLCRTCPGPTRRRAHPASDGRCTTCASA